MNEADIRKALIKAGVENLKEYGYPAVTAENILTDRIYSAFFKSMLADNKGKAGPKVDKVLDDLAAEIERVEQA